MYRYDDTYDLCDFDCPHHATPLRRPADERVLGGVCSGIARWMGWETWLVRAGFLAAALVTSVAPTAVVYMLLWVVMPTEPRSRRRYRWQRAR